jgi:transposase-like protein
MDDTTEVVRGRDTQQEAFAAALVGGHTIESAGRSLGLSPATSYRWAGDPRVVGLVGELRAEVRRRIVDALATGCTLAVATLIEIARDCKSEHARVNASLGLLSTAREWIELEQLARQVTELEDRVGDRQPAPQPPRERARLELLVNRERPDDA